MTLSSRAPTLSVLASGDAQAQFFGEPVTAAIAYLRLDRKTS